MSHDSMIPRKESLDELVRRLVETDAAIGELLGSEDTVIEPGWDLGLGPQVSAGLDQVYSNLETIVEERTAALQRANEELSAMNEELAATEETLRQQNVELEIARQTIDQESARYHTLFELAPDGYLVTEPSTVIGEANAAAAAQLGEAPDMLYGRRLPRMSTWFGSRAPIWPLSSSCATVCTRYLST